MPDFDVEYLDRNRRAFKSGRVSKPWRGFLYRDGKRYYLGHFATREEAEAREKAERSRRDNEDKLFGVKTTGGKRTDLWSECKEN